MEYIAMVINQLKTLNRFSVHVIVFGLRLSFGLIVLSAFFYLLLGRYGDYMSTFLCAKGALDAAPAVLTSAVASALISDIVVRERT